MKPSRESKPKGSKREREPAEKPVSLAPLTFEEAVANLAAVNPPKRRPSDD
jgi:hypothetical protein